MKIKKFGTNQDYQTIWQEMHDFTENRDKNTDDEIWLLEHTPVFTQGLAGKPEHVLNPGDIPVVQTDRGGQITYHGPGQLVGYVLLDLKRHKIGIRTFVNLLENSVINLLAEYNIQAAADPHAPGVYVNGAKICSLGLRIRRGCSYHGIALNVSNNLEPFSRINPCGFRNLKITKINDFVSVPMTEIEDKFVKHFQLLLNSNSKSIL